MSGSEGDVCKPDELVDRLVAAVRQRSDELQGKATRLQVTLTGDRTRSFRIVVTASGAVAVLEPANLAGEEFFPHVVLVGTAAELIRFLTGRVSWRSAIDSGIVIPYVDAEDFEPLRQLVASELSEILGGG